MKLEISNKTDNPLFNRTRIAFETQHDAGEATPSRKKAKDVLAARLGADKELLVIGSIKSQAGSSSSSGVAYLYKDKKSFDGLAFEYLKKRDLKVPKAEKTPAGKVPVEEEKPAEEKAEEKKEEAKE